MKQNLILLTVFLTALPAFSAEYYVDALRPDDSGTGTNWDAAKKTIQAAVDLTVDGDIVWVTNGIYVLSGEISVTNAITIRSVNGPEMTVVDGGGSNRCFNLHDSACLISGFSIMNGFSWDGAGVYCDSTAPAVSNCTFSANVAYTDRGSYGGGMYRGRAYNCTFTGNSACFGGGLAEGNAYDCVFSNNTVNTVSLQLFAHGGGQYKGNAHRCIFIENTSDFAGGGIALGEASECLFINNSASGYGGGMSSGKALNCTFINNWAYSGGGMSAGSVGGTTNIAYNCIFFENTASEYGPDFFYTLVYNSCSSELIAGVNGNITNAPLFVDAANGDFRLQSNSPCINWGNNSVVSSETDLGGNPRIIEGTVDMGAYEYQEIIGLADSDNDGICDDWERQYGGNQNPDLICANGINTILEAYIAGLDPNDPDSKFSFTVEVGTFFGNILRWQPVSGRKYTIYCSTNLLSGFIPLIEHLVTGEGIYIDEVYEHDGPRYYKIGVKIDNDPDDNVTPPSPLP